MYSYSILIFIIISVELGYYNTGHNDSKPIVYNLEPLAAINSSENQLTSLEPPPVIPIPLEEESTSDISKFI